MAAKAPVFFCNRKKEYFFLKKHTSFLKVFFPQQISPLVFPDPPCVLDWNRFTPPILQRVFASWSLLGLHQRRSMPYTWTSFPPACNSGGIFSPKLEPLQADLYFLSTNCLKSAQYQNPSLINPWSRISRGPVGLWKIWKWGGINQEGGGVMVTVLAPSVWLSKVIYRRLGESFCSKQFDRHKWGNHGPDLSATTLALLVKICSAIVCFLPWSMFIWLLLCFVWEGCMGW